MDWLIFALVAAAAFGLRRIIHRHVMKTESAYSYALIENVLTAFAFLPLVISEFAVPTAGIAWLLLAASSGLYVFVALTGYLAYKYTPVTLKEPLSQSNMVFVLVLSAVFLSETITTQKLVGTAAIFLGLLILTYKKRKIFGRLSDKGVQITLLSAFLYAIVSIIDKAAMSYFTPGMYGFLVYFIPGMILLSFVQKRQSETRQLISKKWPFVLGVVILGMLGFYFNLKAYTLADASLVFPIIRLSTLVSVTGGFLVFRDERKEVLKKLLATAIIISGVLLISGCWSLF